MSLASLDTNVTLYFSRAFDLNELSHGRWLDRNEKRQRARKLKSYFHALPDLAVKQSPGTKRDIGCDNGRYKSIMAKTWL
jgi:hypothetical protein